MRLKELVENCPAAYSEIDVCSLAYKPEQCEKGALFFCLHGEEEAHQAVNNGAVCVLSDKAIDNCVNIPVADIRRSMSFVSARFYGDPQNSMKFVGVTGTNGKTTTTYMIASVLSATGKKTGIIGTLGAFAGDKQIAFSGMTTPDPPELFRTLAVMRDLSVEYVVMEVSAHALALKKTDAVFFEVAAFTNLGSDHMDFFVDKDSYAAAKESLFLPERRHFAVFNVDDAAGRRFYARYGKNSVTYGLYNPADVFAINEQYSLGGVRFVMNLCDDIIKVSCALPGKCNVYNALCAAAVCKSLGVSESTVTDGLKKLSGVPGRFNVISGVKNKIVIDFAHTAESLKNAICSLKQCSGEKIVVVFGCGGDRDKTKRPEMGKVASDNADFCVVTSDNPRFEQPEKIIDDICSGIKKDNYIAIPERTQAIKYALECAGDNGVVLIAGKGGEKYQEIRGVKYEYSDETFIRSLIEEKVIE